MGTSTKIAVNNPALLRWARESAGYTVEDIATRLKRSPEVVASWETGEDAPTYRQLVDFAAKVKRPLSTLFLPEVPQEPPLPHDFRRPSGSTQPEYSPELRLWARVLRNHLRDLSEVFADMGRPQTLRLPEWTVSDAPSECAAQLRGHIGISLSEQMAWRNPYEALNAWRSTLFDAGVVTQVAPIPADEARGFSLIGNGLGGICLSTKDSPSARIFSLWHEVAHLCLRRPGISGDPVSMPPRGDLDGRVEHYCDRVAAAFLVPPDDPAIRSAMQELSRDFCRATASRLASRLCVSKYVVARLALDEKVVEADRYWTEIETWWTEDRRVKGGGASGGGDHWNNKLSQLGRRYVGTILEAVDRDAISPSDAAHMLDIKTHQLETTRERIAAG